MRKILIVIDMQKDFIDGALGTREAVSIVPSVISKMKTYNRKDIYATRDTHEENYLQTQEGLNLPVRHCIRGTAGWQLHPDIQALVAEDHIIDKPSFGSIELGRLMHQLAVEQQGALEIELIGLCTDICVVSNALIIKAFLPEVKVSVDGKCCAGVTPERHGAALETMRSCQVNVIE